MLGTYTCGNVLGKCPGLLKICIGKFFGLLAVCRYIPGTLFCRVFGILYKLQRQVYWTSTHVPVNPEIII